MNIFLQLSLVSRASCNKSQDVVFVPFNTSNIQNATEGGTTCILIPPSHVPHYTLGELYQHSISYACPVHGNLQLQKQPLWSLRNNLKVIET